MEKQKERRKSRKEVMSDLISNPSSVSKYISTGDSRREFLGIFPGL